MIGIAILGFGWWGEVLAAELAQMPEFRIEIIADPDPSAIDRTRRAGYPATHSAADAITSDLVQAVVVCTPNGRHRDDVTMCAAAGKHVLCEKPLALKVDDALAMVEACQERETVLAVGYKRRFEPAVEEILRRAKSGDLGRLQHVEGILTQERFFTGGLPDGSWRLSADQAPAGPLTATGVHVLDLATALLGCPDTATAHVRQLGSGFPNGDTFSALMSYESGGTANLAAMLATTPASRFAVYGDQGWMEVTADRDSETESLTCSLRGAAKTEQTFSTDFALKSELQAFAAAVRGERPYPISPTDLLATVSATEAVVESALTGVTVQARALDPKVGARS